MNADLEIIGRAAAAAGSGNQEFRTQPSARRMPVDRELKVLDF